MSGLGRRRIVLLSCHARLHFTFRGVSRPKVSQESFIMASRSVSSFFQKPLNFIGGERVAPTDHTQSFKVFEPATGNLLCESASSSQEDVNRAVAAAKEASQQWSETPALERARVLQGAARLMRERVEEFATMETVNVGKSISESRGDIFSATDALEFFAGLAPSLAGEHFQYPGGTFGYTVREPLGVCAGIGAWNFPIQMVGWKSAPALAAGNTMVFKPSPFTPATAVMFAEALIESGLPRGAFNVVQGQAVTGNALTTHPDVAKVSFTGSVATGKHIMRNCADDLKHVTLELGGKSPLIIFADADLDNAVKGAMLANFLTQGEVCSNATKVYVERSIKDQFVERLLGRVNALRLGDPLREDTQVGALISKEHMEKVLGYIEGAKKQGATVLCGGERVIPEDPKLANGYFVSPCVMDNLTDNMTIIKEETFGPVLTLLTFDTEAEVTQRANDTPLGLSGGVFTKDIQRAHRFIKNLQAGSCWINTYNMYPVGWPFGGYKQSGLGRENAAVTLNSYTQLKSVYVEMGDVESPV
ncbi:4-trimethylaminobutyraldehyde dehydrogenase-like [Patiria miniata]|uniref:Aldehyde dehydrogenase domain-containing protein n=1 Tax=Patiria miniata TaxID=46514 RepID=A0A913Z6M9_PATMI|nr:4-trimethylaminobutyraldehyde dehydrogenase-like [Patiria miniata]